MHSHTSIPGYVQLAVVLALLLAVVLPANAQVGLAMSPLRLELKGEPGKPLSGSLALINSAPDVVRVKAQLLDFYVDDSATPQFGVFEKEAPFSCRTWLTINPMDTELAAKGNQTVRYTLRVPQGLAPGSYYCSARCVTAASAEGLKSTGIKMAVAVAPTFYVFIGDPKIEADVAGVKLIAPKGDFKDWRVAVQMENRGTMRARPVGTVEVLDQQSKVIESLALPTLPLLPKRVQTYPVILKTDLSKEPYTVRVRIDLGTGEIQEARIVTTK